MRVVAMFRVSTERQANEGASLDAQERIYHELARERGWRTVTTFRGAESATQAATERRVLQEVLACIAEQAPDALYVHEQSRLTRGDELEVARLLRELREQQVKIIVGGVIRDMASIDERFMVGIQSLVDRAESERIKERVSRGKRERAKQGKKNCGISPLGYRNPPVGDPDRGILRIVEDEARVVRRIFDLAGKGLSSRAISETLTREGMSAPKGGIWGKTSIFRILNNPCYLGVHVTGGWVAAPGSRTFRFDLKNERAIVIPDAHPPIITREQWALVHDRPKPARTRTPRLLTGMLWVNGHRVSGDSNQQVGFYRGPRGVEGLPWLPVPYTEESIWTAFVSIGTDERFLSRLIRQSENDSRSQSLAADVRRVEETAEKLRKRLDALIDMRADGEIDKTVYADRSRRTQDSLKQAEERLGDLRAAQASTDPERLTAVVSAVRSLVAGHRRLSDAQKRAVLRSVVRRIDAKADRTSIGQERKEKGQYSSAKAPCWTLRTVTFHLGIPRKGSHATANRYGVLDTTS